MPQRVTAQRPRARKRGPLRSPTRKVAERRSKGPVRTRVRETPAPDALSQKLHKVLAQGGLGSRRTMEEWIRDGRVTVNGQVAAIGARVGPQDLIRVGHKVVRWPMTQRLPRVLVYHKPEGEIVSHDDPQGRASVFQRLPALRGAKWLAVGRLDYNTSGLLVFTTSGELANRMMHPRFAVEREYAVRIVGELSAEQASRLTSGIQLADGPAAVLSLEDEGGEGTNHWYRIVLREGRNRVVRRLFEALGLTVSRLIRVRFGVIALPPRLKRGQVSALPAAEVKRLLEWLDETAPPAAGSQAAPHAQS